MYGNLILFNLLSVPHWEIYLTFAVHTTEKMWQEREFQTEFDSMQTRNGIRILNYIDAQKVCSFTAELH